MFSANVELHRGLEEVQMGTKVFVSSEVLADLLAYFGVDNVREMLNGYEVIVYDEACAAVAR
jgi:hypothetical protein